MEPAAELVHWMFAAGFLGLGVMLVAEAVVGEEVWRRRAWRAYLWPSVLLLMGVLMWPVMVFFTSSTIHMLAHGSWAQVMMLAGAAELGLVSGKLTSPFWRLCVALAFAGGGLALIVHEQNPWLFQRSAFLHHFLWWMMLVCTVFPLGRALRPRSLGWNGGFALVFVALAVVLFCDRDVAPIFGHLSPLAGAPHR
jgi:hypothetical protein